LLALVAMVAAAWVDPMGRVLPMAAAHLGALLIVAGIGAILWVQQVFEDAGTTTKPFHTSSVLVMDGPFRFSRNPMYLGMVVILVGVGLALRSLLPLAIVPVFALAIQWRFILPEERALERDFGDAYRGYCETVRRWL
jgi:protein-S-isoprenylcysteine O-methyltransferase Ste14